MKKNLLFSHRPSVKGGKSVARRWGIGVAAIAIAGLCTASAFGDAQIKKISVTHTNTELWPTQSEMDQVTEYEYNSEGLLCKTVGTYGDTAKFVYTSNYAYSGESLSPFCEGREFVMMTSETTNPFGYLSTYYNQYIKDSDGRISGLLNINGSRSVSEVDQEYWSGYLTSFTYDEEGTPWVDERQTYDVTVTSVSPFTYTLGSLKRTEKYVWLESANNYVLLVNDSDREIVLRGDTIVTTYWTDGNRTEIKEKRWELYAERKKVMEKYHYGGTDLLTWYGSKDPLIEVDSMRRVTTTYKYSLDEYGNFYASSKEERSFNYGEPGANSHMYTYSRKSPGAEWEISEYLSADCVWKSNGNILEFHRPTIGGTVSEVKYDNDLNRLGSIKRISPSQYYVLALSPSHREFTITYFTSSHQVDRKLKGSLEENYLYPIFREWNNGEWVMPIQSFWLDNYERLVNHPGGNDTKMAEIRWNATLDCPAQETYYYYDTTENKYVVSKYRFWLSNKLSFYTQDRDYNGKMYDVQDATFTQIGTNTLGVTVKNTPRYGNDSQYYTEYDKRRRLVHNHRYDASTKNFTYAYTDCLAADDYAYETSDTTTSCNVKYDRATDALSGTMTRTLKENDRTMKWKYVLSAEDGRWKLLEEATTEMLARPEWVQYELPEGINVTFQYNQGSPYYYKPSFDPKTRTVVNSYISPVPMDENKIINTYDEITGEQISTTKEYYEYLDEPYFCERRLVREEAGEVFYPNQERYEKNSAGLLTGWYKKDGENEKGSRYYYNNHKLMVRAEVEETTPTVYLFSYYGESDEIDDSGVEDVTASPQIAFLIQGRGIRSVDTTEFTVYAIDGRSVAHAIDGFAEVPDGGIYILVAGDKRVKVLVK